VSQKTNETDGNITLHELMQPLNIIRLCCGNIRDRIGGQLDEVEAAYLAAKLGRVEEQVVRMNELLRKHQGSITS